MKIRPVEAKLLDADGQTSRQTDRHDEANSRFFAILPTRQKIKKKQGTGLSSCAHTELWAKIGQLFQKLKGEKPEHTQARTRARPHT